MGHDDFIFDRNSDAYVAVDSTWRITVRNTFREEIDIKYTYGEITYVFSSWYFMQNGSAWIGVAKKPVGFDPSQQYENEETVLRRLTAVLNILFGDCIRFV